MKRKLSLFLALVLALTPVSAYGNPAADSIYSQSETYSTSDYVSDAVNDSDDSADTQADISTETDATVSDNPAQPDVEVITSEETYEDSYFAEGALEEIEETLDETLELLEAQSEEEQIVYISQEAAAEELKNQLLTRTEEFTLHVNVPGYSRNTMLVRNMFELATAHTGVGNEGDYLYWSISGWYADKNAVAVEDGSSNVDIKLIVSYKSSAEEEAYIDEQLSSIESSLNLSGKTTYAKAYAVYDYICKNVSYDYTNVNSGDTYPQMSTAYGPLKDGKGICIGYSVLLYRMLLDAGVNNRVICGYGAHATADTSSSGGYHAWNILKIGDSYYNGDTTWDAVNSTYKYFLVGSNNFTDHISDADYVTDEFTAKYPISQTNYRTSSSQTTDHLYDTGVVAKEATCTEEGSITYTCLDCGETVTEVIPAAGHTYNITWNWNTDYSSASASYVCVNDPSHTGSTTDVTVDESEKDDIITYTASVTLDGVVYQSEKRVHHLSVNIGSDLTFTESSSYSSLNLPNNNISAKTKVYNKPSATRADKVEIGKWYVIGNTEASKYVAYDSDGTVSTVSDIKDAGLFQAGWLRDDIESIYFGTTISGKYLYANSNANWKITLNTYTNSMAYRSGVLTFGGINTKTDNVSHGLASLTTQSYQYDGTDWILTPGLRYPGASLYPADYHTDITVTGEKEGETILKFADDTYVIQVTDPTKVSLDLKEGENHSVLSSVDPSDITDENGIVELVVSHQPSDSKVETFVTSNTSYLYYIGDESGHYLKLPNDVTSGSALEMTEDKGQATRWYAYKNNLGYYFCAENSTYVLSYKDNGDGAYVISGSLTGYSRAFFVYSSESGMQYYDDLSLGLRFNGTDWTFTSSSSYPVAYSYETAYTTEFKAVKEGTTQLTIDGVTYTITVDHDRELVWNWSEDNKNAELSAVCRYDQEILETAAAEVTVERTDDTITYTAKATIAGKEYTDEKSAKLVSVRVTEGETAEITLQNNYATTYEDEFVSMTSVRDRGPSSKTITDPKSGTFYYIGDGDGHYLNYNTDRDTFSVGSASNASLWTIGIYSSGLSLFDNAYGYALELDISSEDSELKFNEVGTTYAASSFSVSDTGLHLASSGYTDYRLAFNGTDWVASTNTEYNGAYIYERNNQTILTFRGLKAGNTSFTIGATVFEIEVAKPDEVVTPGDEDGTEQSNLMDLVLLKQYIIGMNTGDFDLEKFDINSDGVVDDADAEVLAKILAGIHG